MSLYVATDRIASISASVDTSGGNAERPSASGKSSISDDIALSPPLLACKISLYDIQSSCFDCVNKYKKEARITPPKGGLRYFTRRLYEMSSKKYLFNF